MKRVYFKSAVPVWEKGMEKEMNYSLIFRTEVGQDAQKLRIAGSSVYNIYINGEFFAHGPARTAHGFYRVDELPLLLDAENNQIEIYVTAANVRSFYSINVPGFLCCEIEGGDSRIMKATGTDFYAMKNPFRIQKTSRYSYQRTFDEVYRMCMNSEEIPVELEQTEDKCFIAREVFYSEYEKKTPISFPVSGRWEKTAEPQRVFTNRCLKKVGEVLDGYREEELDSNPADELGHMRYLPDNAAEVDKNDFKLANNRYTVCEFERDLTGLLSFEITCCEPVELYVCMDEILSDGFVDYMRLSAINICRWSFEPGTYKITTAEPYTFKFISLAVSGAAEIKNIQLITLCYPTIEKKLCFRDEKLDKIYDAAVETFRQNALDVYTDCPSRERAGWLCDSFFTGRTEFALTGKTVVEKAFLENFLLPEHFENLPEGMLPMCYPADFYDGQFIPNWAMFYVLELQEYAHRSGDTALVRAAKERMYKLLDYFRPFENENGMLVNLEKWIFVEWSACNDYVQDLNFPTNMLYAKTKRSVGEMYGDELLISESEKLQDAIRQMAYKDGFFHDRAVWRDSKLEVTEELTETCQYYAFFCDTASPATFPQLWKTMLEDFGPERKTNNRWKNVAFSNAFIGNYLRLEMLSRYGEDERLIRNIRDYFYKMAELTGTLWEYDTTFASCNHGFASHAAVWLIHLSEKYDL